MVNNSGVGHIVKELFTEEKVVKGGDMSGAFSFINMTEVYGELLPHHSKTGFRNCFPDCLTLPVVATKIRVYISDPSNSVTIIIPYYCLYNSYGFR